MKAAVMAFASLALCGSISVYADTTTYAVNVEEGIRNGITGTITPDVNDLFGSFSFNNGVFSNLDLIINGAGAADVVVQSAVDSFGYLTFSYTDAPSDSTSYGFLLSGPLGGSAQTISASDVDFAPFDSAQFGNDSCGGALYGQSGPNASTYTCSGSLAVVSSSAAAPEIEPAGTLPALTLLLGVLAVLRGRRRENSF